MTQTAFQTFKLALTADNRAIAQELHSLLLAIEPGYQVKPAWNGLGYRYGKNYSCLLVGYTDHIKLMIWRGIELDDPSGQLRGSGVNTRHLRFDSVEDVARADLESLLRQQFALFDQGMTAERKPKSRLGKNETLMPDYVLTALEQADLLDAYESRPPYQRNDYLSWITGAKREQTRQKRLHQMLAELSDGGVYMGMGWKGK